MLRSWLACMLLAACATEPVESIECAPVDASRVCDPSAFDTLSFRIEALELASADPTGRPDIVEGLDLDCRVSDEEDPAGCFQLDFEGHDGQRGIDNQVGPIIDSIGIDGVDGALLVPLRLEIDAPRTDGCPIVARLIQGDNVISSSSGIARGHELHAVFPEMVLSIPLEDGSMTLPWQARLASGHVIVHRDGGPRAVLGGVMPVADLIVEATRILPAYAPTLISTVLTGQADLQPDPAGNCTAISVGFTFEAVRD